MKPLLFLGIYIFIVISVTQFWLLPAILGVLLFCVKYNSAFLIPGAIMIDGYYGSFYSLPLISILSVFWFAIFEQARPMFANFRSG